MSEEWPEYPRTWTITARSLAALAQAAQAVYALAAQTKDNMIKDAIRKVVDKIDLTKEESAQVMNEIMGGQATPSQITAFMTAMRMKGETVDEITSFALVMRKFAIKISPKVENLLDTCGTGGDSSGSFNISTVSAIIAAAAGGKLAKHGNRSASSKCGSADILETAGVKIDLAPDKVEKCIEEIGIGFLYAPNFHPAMKYAGPSRKEIGIRTFFNILGPLSNPAGAKNQLIGVFAESMTEFLTKVLKNLGANEVMVVFGKDTLDEISVSNRTKISHLKGGKISNYEISPSDFGIKQSKKEDCLGGTADDNLKIMLRILKDKEKGPKRDIVLLNTAAALTVGQISKDIKTGIALAGETIDNGKAYKKLEQLIEFTNKG
jgi:anthranilate phosphoribosyltransferase